MQRGRGGPGGIDDFFGFGNSFGGFMGLGGGPGSMISNFFGGRDPFDDPFFTGPFGRPFGSLMGPSMFGPNMILGGIPFGEATNADFLEQQAIPSKSKGPIITELSSDGEEEEEGEGDKQSEEKTDNPRKHSRSSKELFIEEPDEENEGKKSKHMQYTSNINRVNTAQPQGHTYSFQSSTVTYGGPNGPYYTSSSTRKSGGDGVFMEEKKEADSATRKATHKISRGIRDKGHSVTRKLNTDGRVETLQTLHNLHEDEVSGFEEAWKGNARKHFPSWNLGRELLDNGNNRAGGRLDARTIMPRAGLALPSSTEQQPQRSGRMNSESRRP